MHQQRIFYGVIALGFCLMLNACGFSLKGHYYLDDSLRTIYLSSEKRFSPLAKTLKERLIKNQVTVLDKFSEQNAQIHILPESFQRRTLSLFPNGQVAEYELIYVARFVLNRPTMQSQSFSVELRREFRDDPNNALAKERERSLILDELRVMASERILAQLNQLN